MIERLKVDKAVEGDEIPGEMWNFGRKRMINFEWEICNRVNR